MGTGLRATCDCGFMVAQILAGGGFANHGTICWAPALCAACKQLVVGNYLSKRPRCPKCRKKVVFYDVPSLREARADGESDEATDVVFSWFTGTSEFRLPAACYLCPRCGKFKLRFVKSGLMWD